MHEEHEHTKSFRSQVLRDAEVYGVLTAAAMHNVGELTIYRWRQERIEQENWIDICARHITMENVVIALIGFVGIIAVSHAIAFFLERTLN